ncbi:MAG: UDP-N-acetylglucosamine 2-epimerase (non-hydrolyzing) [Methanobacteriota archaeon]|nr:MAG: UDP-N-acetylglucosamine 2-epimerase (non-hydrolyzing) [Euryarchaeota archaeon]
MDIVSVVGARPQFIKAAQVSREIRKKHKEILLHTGQHYDPTMSATFFDELEIPEPDYNLGVGSGSHAEQTGRMVIGIEEVLLKEKPQLVLVYGDTNSTLGGALASVKVHIPVAHVEAGLRSFNRSMPEEVNRVIVDRVSHLLFCPTKTAVKNLENEGLTKGVHLVGDVMYDAALHNKALAEDRGILEKLGVKRGNYLLVTVHRPSNTDSKENLAAIVDALVSCGEDVVFPAHPRAVKLLKRYELYEELKEGIHLIEPVGYLDFTCLLMNAKKMITDSGGVQKEAYFHEIPCITLREETEWVETAEDGWNILVGADKGKILNSINSFDPKGKRRESYGDGKASKKISDIIDDEFS